MAPEKLVITALPIEILSNVFVHLDYPSLLAVKITCKALHFATRSRQLWYEVLAKLEEDYHLNPPEEELNNYTIEELEHWISVRSRAQGMWAGSIQPRSQKRPIVPHPDSKHPCAKYWKILPGGRWLLTAHTQALMIYMLDLDSTDPQPRLLFDARDLDQRTDGGHHKVNHFIWIDRSKPRLSFRIAGVFGDRDKPETYIYQVDLVGHGAGATLVASRYSMFQHYRWRMALFPSKFAISGHYAAEIVDNTELATSNQEIMIYHYCEALGQSGYHPVEPIVYPFDKGFCKMVEFIHDDVFVVVTSTNPMLSSDTLHIFEISCPDGSSSPDSIRLLHMIPFNYTRNSSIYWSPGISRIVMLKTRHEIEGLVIPHDKTIRPTTVKLGKSSLNYGDPLMLGISASLFFTDSRDNAETVVHDWDPKIPTPVKGVVGTSSDHALSIPSYPLAFSDDIGRMVFVKNSSASFFVLDLI